MRRLFILTIVASALFAIQPIRTHAANLDSKILPNCDQTKYIIQSKSGTPAGTKEIPPEQFDTTTYPKTDWEVVDYTLTSNCGFNEFLQIFVNLFNWGLYVLSILSLFFFFLGGGTLLLSGGNEERVRAGKAILVNTVIGLVIALSSWVIVNLTMNALLPEGQKQKAGAALIGNQPWFRVSGACDNPPTSPCSNSSVVRTVQTLLTQNNCYAGVKPDDMREVDGNFGPKTLAAWNKWQTANGEKPTGTLEGYDLFNTSCVQ